MECALCGTELEGSRFCPLCGTPRPGDVSEPELRVCSFCGSVMPADAAFCRICGAARESVKAEEVSFSSELLCPSCGSSFNPGESYCRQCGAMLPALSAYPSAKLRRRKITLSEHFKKVPVLLRACAILVLAAVAAVILAATLSDGRGGDGPELSRLDSSFIAVKATANRFTVFLSDGTSVRVRCENFLSYLTTPDRSAFLVADLTGAYEDGSPLGRLILVRGGKAVTVCREASLVSYALSDSGQAAAYVSETDASGHGTLYLYDARRDSSEEISSGVLSEGAIALSPDGRSVSFIGEYFGEHDYGCFVSVNGGKPQRVTDRAVPVAVADGGSPLYFYSGGILYASADGKNTKLTDSVGYYADTDCWFSEDYREVVYSDGGTCYISTDGAEGLKLADSPAAGLILPKDAAVKSFGGAVACLVSGYKHLARTVWDLEGSLWYFGRKRDMRRISSDYDSCTLSENAASLLWTNEGDLYLIRALDEIGELPPRPTFGSFDVTGYCASPDLKHIYLSDSGGTVYYLKTSGASLVSGVSGGLNVCAVTDSGTLYTAGDIGLFISKKGGKAAEADGFEVCYEIASRGGQLLLSCSDGLYWGLYGDFRRLR